MYKAGMDGVRVNTAYGDIDQYGTIVENVRSLGEIPIVLDIKGPSLRTRMERPLMVRVGDVVEVGLEGRPVAFNHPIYDQVDVGDAVLFDGGRVRTKVIRRDDRGFTLLVGNDGLLENGKGVNVPAKNLRVLTLSERDTKVIEFAKERGVEFIALSFTRSKEDILALRERLGGLRADIIAKIESRQGVENFDEILGEADGVMVARGDLAVEVEPERVPLVQKRMIRMCNQRGKLVITATEMLESMVRNPTPTRAEVSDVANAILDGSDVVMLSAETAIGKYPIESVSMMVKIAEQVESSVMSNVREEGFQNISTTISKSISQIAEAMPLDEVVTLTRSGYTAHMIARFKLRQPIIAVTLDKVVKRKLTLTYGVYPVYFDYEGERDRILAVAQMLHSQGILGEDDLVLFTAGFRTYQRHASNIIEIHTVKELLEFGKGSTGQT